MSRVKEIRIGMKKTQNLGNYESASGEFEVVYSFSPEDGADAKKTSEIIDNLQTRVKKRTNAVLKDAIQVRYTSPQEAKK
jgi:hypothetical protein|tara:strand:+ start:4308 stop:4547 length:240 start_codon:yes stop_codon:yes gene_type:complete